MWCVRHPRKLLFVALAGSFIWMMFSYLLVKLHDRSPNIKVVEGDTESFQYDDQIQENAVWKNTFQSKNDFLGEKLKLDKAVDREEKNNEIKQERLQRDLEYIEVMDPVPERPNTDFISHQVSKYDNPNPTELITRHQKIISSVFSVKKKSAPSEPKYVINENTLKFSHNESVSQTISFHRALPDVRDTLCMDIKYRDDLPYASVIIVFYNEAWTTLLRTVHSIIDRTPRHLLREIILIDDFSDYENLQLQLRDYLDLLPKVVLRRTTSRVGVVAGRQIGASMATGHVLVFLDSHCECTIGWLEPLLARIRESETHVVSPVMDIIDDQTFEYRSFDSKSINIGGFDWNLQFIWIGVPERVQKLRRNEVDLIRSPTMPGGMFAISKKYFDKLGGYDPGMDMWGAENLEMSFKIWMCGGTLETVPCSHVGHLFRRGITYKLGNGDSRKNFYRLAEVWLDEYKELYYQKTNKAVEISEDVASRVALRQQLKCESFGWYLKNIYPELFIPSEALASGEIRNKEEAFADGTRFPGCLDAASDSTAAAIRIWPCHNQGGNQLWLLSKSGEIRRDEVCMDYSGGKVVILPCHGQQGNQAWEYLADGSIKHSNSKLCMGLSNDGGALVMSTCSGKSDQIWNWKRQQQEKLQGSEHKMIQDLALGEY